MRIKLYEEFVFKKSKSLDKKEPNPGDVVICIKDCCLQPIDSSEDHAGSEYYKFKKDEDYKIEDISHNYAKITPSENSHFDESEDFSIKQNGDKNFLYFYDYFKIKE